MERDTGINILGDSGKGACLTWLPVDQLQGSTDLYAKYKTAGYFEDTYACNSVTGYIDLRESYHTKGEQPGDDEHIACAEVQGDCQTSNPYTAIGECIDNVHCPKDYFAIMGQCLSDNNRADGTPDVDDGGQGGDTFAEDCAEYAYTGHEAEDADCPYVCVPKGSRHTADGTVCSPSGSDYDAESDDGTDVYLYSNGSPEEWPETDDYQDFDNTVDVYDDCEIKGVELDDDVYSAPTEASMECSYDCGGVSDTDDCCYLNFNTVVYAGCAEVTEVATTDESYAWTDRLLGGEQSTFAIDGSSGGVSYPDMEYTYSTTNGPYGMNLSELPLSRSSYDPPLRIGQCKTTELDFMTNPTDSGDGLFTDCPSGYSGGTYEGEDFTLATKSLGARSFIDFLLDIDSVYNFTYDPESYRVTWNRINQIFALPTVGPLYEWGGTGLNSSSSTAETLAYTTDSTETAADTYTDTTYLTDARDEGAPPKIWAIDTDHCYGSYCREGAENELTLNSSNDTDQTGAGGFFRATLKFFAAADKNQLPIRRVIVDWGDNGDMTGSNDSNNFYKNHRGLEETSQTTLICSACDAGLETAGCEWGMTADSCDPNYFTYQHNYSCNESDLSDLPACGDVDFNEDGIGDVACAENSKCVFRPRVQVRDNWGWCSGVCTAGADDQDGCFENSGDSITDINDPDSECAYDYYPTNNGVSKNIAVDPWVYYDGVITVEP